MKTQLMRHFAVAIGLSVCAAAGFSGTATAQGYTPAGTYQAPQQWSSFQAPRRIGSPAPRSAFGATVRGVAMQTGAEELPAPAPQLDHASPHAAQHMVPQMTQPRVAPQQHLHQPQQVHQSQHVQHSQPVYQSQPVHQPAHQHVHQSHPVIQSQPVYPSQAVPTPVIHEAPGSVMAPASADCQSCQTGGYASPYQEAISQPWQGDSFACAPAVISGPQSISPWFGGANILFWQLHDTGDQALVVRDDATYLTRTADLNPGNDVGYDIHIGRYLGCGTFGLDVGFMSWNPGAVSNESFAAGTDLRLALPAMQNLTRDNHTGVATNMYEEFDAAARIRATRNLRIRGIEANLTSFGLMGARRLGSCSPASLLGRFGSRLGQSACGCYGPCNGGCGAGACGSPCGSPCGGGACATPSRLSRSGYYGGAAGPLARACSGRVRVQTLHGFRYFQLKDDLEVVGDVDGVGGYGVNDIWYDLETENNLYGYQFGSRLTYCLGHRAMFNIGGKLGVYANDAEFYQSLGSRVEYAYTAEGAGAGDINTRQTDTSLATLMEFDLGLGYRLSNRCTVRGGYRVLGASGVATALGQTTTEYARAASAGQVRADDSLLLHGAYVGFDYNW